jgi:gluconolactonase
MFGKQIKLWLKRRILAVRCLYIKSQDLLSLFSRNVGVTLVVSGLRFTEGPIWFKDEGYLLFSDIPANHIYRLTPDGQLSVFRENSFNSNGLTRDKQGHLIACEHSTRRITRLEKDGSITILADCFRGKKLNSPNDVVVKSDGSIYFTDPPYGIKPEHQEQSVQGVYRLSPDGNELTIVADDFLKPNGLAFSPDERRLYINDSSERRHIRVFDVRSDGTLANDRLFHDMNVKTSGSPDGMKVDVIGNVYCTGARGVWVFDAHGYHLGTILTPEQPANCAWGDKDWKTLYITAQSSIYKIRVNVPGVQVP